MPHDFCPRDSSVGISSELKEFGGGGLSYGFPFFSSFRKWTVHDNTGAKRQNLSRKMSVTKITLYFRLFLFSILVRFANPGCVTWFSVYFLKVFVARTLLA